MTKKTLPQKNKLRYAAFTKFLIFMTAWAAVVAIAVYDKDALPSWYSHYEVGVPADKDIYSPFNFTFVNDDETELKRVYERDSVSDVFVRNVEHAAFVTNQVEALFALTESELQDEGASELETRIKSRELPTLQIDDMRQLVITDERDQVKQAVLQYIAKYLTRDVITLQEKITLFREGRSEVTVKEGQILSTIPVSSVKTIDEELVMVKTLADELYGRNRRVRSSFIELLSVLVRPTLTYDPVVTQEQRNSAYVNAQPVYDKILKGEVLLRKGQVVTAQVLARLQQIERLRAKKEILMVFVGMGIICGVALLILFVMLSLFERSVFASDKKLLVISIVVVFVFALSKALLSLSNVPDLLPLTPMAPVIIAILISPRSAVPVALVETILIGSISEFDPLFILLGLCGGLLSLYPTIGLRKRSQFALVGLYIAAVNFALMFAYYIVSGANLYEAFTISVSGLVSGAIIFFAIIGATWLFEHVFDITTDIRLLELSDLNQPLMRRLVIEAPGTYHHSLVVSNLAENACEAIGANSLLARVGCYYHDIGKIPKAEYFTENQTSKDQNIHDKLTPSMSCMLITNHIKDGLELGKKYKLKDEILDFIRQHHGRSLIYFFYRRAQDGAKDGETINAEEFRYPGPKPQTKEIAVTMLADSVEAASRSLKKTTPEGITELIDKVVNDKFMDEQLGECNLTFSDLRKIKDSFARNLMGIFHTRIEYPEINTVK